MRLKTEVYKLQSHLYFCMGVKLDVQGLTAIYLINLHFFVCLFVSFFLYSLL